MKEFKAGDIVKVVKDCSRYKTEETSKDIGRCFLVEGVLHGRYYPYVLKGSDKTRNGDELELISIDEIIRRKEEYKNATSNLISENQNLEKQLYYADEQLEKQAKIIEELADLAHELHDKLIEKIKGE